MTSCCIWCVFSSPRLAPPRFAPPLRSFLSSPLLAYSLLSFSLYSTPLLFFSSPHPVLTRAILPLMQPPRTLIYLIREDSIAMSVTAVASEAHGAVRSETESEYPRSVGRVVQVTWRIGLA